MRFHSLQVRIKGTAVDSIDNDELELDIADGFSRLSRSLGFEGEIDTYAGCGLHNSCTTKTRFSREIFWLEVCI